LDPNSTGPYILMGKVLLKKEDPEQALLYLERANKMDSRNFMTHHLMGQAYRALKNNDAAEPQLKIPQQLQSETAPKLRGPMANDFELVRLATHEMADAVRQRKISPVELVQAHLEHIQRLNPTLNAYVDLRADAALEEARSAERRLQSGEPIG